MPNGVQQASTSAMSLVDYFKSDHGSCDGGWAEVEAAVDSGDAAATAGSWTRFKSALLRHLAMEEQLLFPAVEAATGMANAGPTQVMRMEHEQMRGVLEQMAAAVERDDPDELIDQGDTLNILIQQHNMKEEGMLYPMAERLLEAEWLALRDQLDAFQLP